MDPNFSRTTGRNDVLGWKTDGTRPILIIFYPKETLGRYLGFDAEGWSYIENAEDGKILCYKSEPPTLKTVANQASDVTGTLSHLRMPQSQDEVDADKSVAIRPPVPKGWQERGIRWRGSDVSVTDGILIFTESDGTKQSFKVVRPAAVTKPIVQIDGAWFARDPENEEGVILFVVDSKAGTVRGYVYTGLAGRSLWSSTLPLNSSES
jgi:hypothetical protein